MFDVSSPKAREGRRPAEQRARGRPELLRLACESSRGELGTQIIILIIIVTILLIVIIINNNNSNNINNNSNNNNSNNNNNNNNVGEGNSRGCLISSYGIEIPQNLVSVLEACILMHPESPTCPLKKSSSHIIIISTCVVRLIPQLKVPRALRSLGISMAHVTGSSHAAPQCCRDGRLL